MPALPLLLLLIGAAPPDDAETVLQNWANQRVAGVVQLCSVGMWLHGSPQNFTVTLSLSSGQVTQVSVTPDMPSFTPCISDAFRNSTDAPRFEEDLQVEVPVEMVDPPPTPLPGEARAELKNFVVSRGTAATWLKEAMVQRITRCALRASRFEPLRRGQVQLAFSAPPAGELNEPRVIRGSLGPAFRSCVRTSMKGLANPGPQTFRAVGTFAVHPAAKEPR
jgi:hypothetical protein